MRSNWTLFATIVFVALVGCVGQARAETIMCPETVSLDVSPLPEGWTVNALPDGRLSAAWIRDGQLLCGYHNNNGAGFTLRRTIRSGVSCQEIDRGFECDSERVTVRPRSPIISPRLPPSAAIQFVCDLAVGSITLTKLATPGAVRVSYEIVNRGRRAWSSSATEVTATLVVNSSNSGPLLRRDQPVPASGAVGAIMTTFSVDLSDDPFGVVPNTGDFSRGTVSGGTVEVALTFAGNVAESNCHADVLSLNNIARLSGEDVLGFMTSAQRTRTWSF